MMKPASAESKRPGEKGMMFVELLVGIALAGLLIPIIGTASYQLMTVNARSAHDVMALTQVEKAMHWIKRDTEMAQTVRTGLVSGFPLTLGWVDWDNTEYQVVYSLDNDKIYRDYSVNGEASSRTLVAQLINADSAKTNCQYDVGVLSFKVTAFVSGYKSVEETRTAQVMPRPAP